MAPVKVDDSKLVSIATKSLASKTSGILSEKYFDITADSSSWRIRNDSYHAIELHFKARRDCSIAACKFGEHFYEEGVYQAVIVYQKHKNGKYQEQFNRARVIESEKERCTEPLGLVSFAGFVPLRDETKPWAVLLWDGGAEWTFELVTNNGKT